MEIRCVLAIGCFAAFVILSIDPERIIRLFFDRDALRAEAIASPDGPMGPEYPAFLEAVRQRTSNGDVIVLDFPRERYWWGFYRASYFLAGRDVLPPTAENLQRAKYIAVFDRQKHGRLVRR